MITIEIRTNEVETAFEKLDTSLGQGFPTAARRIDVILARSTRITMEQGGRPKYAPAQEKTIAIRKKKRDTRIALRDTDKSLYDPLTSVQGEGGPFQVGAVGPFEVLKGTNAPWGRRLFEGDDRVVARPFLSILPGDVADAKEALAVDVRQKIRAL